MCEWSLSRAHCFCVQDARLWRFQVPVYSFRHVAISRLRPKGLQDACSHSGRVARIGGSVMESPIASYCGVISHHVAFWGCDGSRRIQHGQPRPELEHARSATRPVRSSKEALDNFHVEVLDGTDECHILSFDVAQGL